MAPTNKKTKSSSSFLSSSKKTTTRNTSSSSSSSSTRKKNPEGTLLFNILKNKNTTETTKICDFETGDDLLIPSDYVVNDDDEIKALPCKYRITKSAKYCATYRLEEAYKKIKDPTKSKEVINQAHNDIDDILPFYDDTFLYCANPFCTNTTGDVAVPTSSTFHASCYGDMIKSEQGKKYHITKKEYSDVDPLSIIQTLVFPVCRLACWNDTSRFKT